MSFFDLFPSKPLIGMIHLRPLPGSARFSWDFDEVIRFAVEDARRLEEGGADAVMVENFFDAPFHKDSVSPVTVAAMTAAVIEVRKAISLPIGVNVLRNDIVSAISIANVCGASFVRCNVYVGAAVTDQGIIEGAARQACSIRKELDARVLIFADVGVKHASTLGEYPISMQASDAIERGLADAVIVTGPATGAETPESSIIELKTVSLDAPVLVGSGLDVANAAKLMRIADGAIVGTALKESGLAGNQVDSGRVRRLAKIFDGFN